MPIFDYKCLHCGDTVEKIVKNDQTEVGCPNCGEVMTKKVGAPSFRLKGDGWYQTDFKGSKQNE